MNLLGVPIVFTWWDLFLPIFIITLYWETRTSKVDSKEDESK